METIIPETKMSVRKSNKTHKAFLSIRIFSPFHATIIGVRHRNHRQKTGGFCVVKQMKNQMKEKKKILRIQISMKIDTAVSI